jgi:hypothetical protein
MSHLNFGAAKNAKNIILMQKKIVVNAIEINTIIIKKIRGKA